MKAIQIQSHGGPEVLKLSTLQDPEPAFRRVIGSSCTVGA